MLKVLKLVHFSEIPSHFDLSLLKGTFLELCNA
jgi:hypothetical protein